MTAVKVPIVSVADVKPGLEPFLSPIQTICKFRPNGSSV